MRTYFAIVHKDADSAFGISFPDLPGCFSASDSEADVYANAQEALSLYLQNSTEVAPPRSIEELRRDRSIEVDLAAGAYLIGVPVVYSSRKERYNLMLDRAQVECVDAIANRVGVSRSEFVARAIEMRMRTEVGVTVLARDTAKATKPSSEATSGKVASAAAKVMKDPKASKEAKSAAASALTQKGSKEKTGAKVASGAGKVLRSKTASAAEKSVAASALTQKAGKAAPAKKAPAKKKM